jgi:hypothetical protein
MNIETSPKKASLKMNVVQVGGVVAGTMRGEYTMVDYYSNLPLIEARDFAKSKLALKDKFIIKVDSDECLLLRAAALKYLGISGKEMGESLCSRAPLVPLQSSLCSYTILKVGDRYIGISPKQRIGFQYGEVFPEWIKEAGRYSSIQLPE